MCSGCNQHVLHELNTTSSSRWSSNTPSQGNSIPLNAERVSCTENTLKQRMGQTHCQGRAVSCKIQSSRTVPSWCQVPGIALPPPSHQLCPHVICTDLVAQRHSWFWHITTLISVLADRSLYRRGFHVQSRGAESGHRPDSVVPLPTSHS